MTTKPTKSGLLSFSFWGRVLSRKSMRPVVRVMTNMHVRLYRWTGGRAQAPKYPTMLLTTAGRKTGKPRTVPLVYVEDKGRFIIAAAYAGSDQSPTWWLNLQHSKTGVVQVMRRKVRVRAELARPEEREDLWRRLVAMYPYFTGYQERTTRQIPVIVLTPVNSSTSAQQSVTRQVTGM
ncbi:MAG: nitroreductase/quinone reductase family protein [Anaerolineae bacterium]